MHITNVHLIEGVQMGNCAVHGVKKCSPYTPQLYLFVSSYDSEHAQANIITHLSSLTENKGLIDNWLI